MQSPSTSKNEDTKVSIPLHRFNPSTIKKITNTNKKINKLEENNNKMDNKRRPTELAAQESDAHLLLNLSGHKSNTNNGTDDIIVLDSNNCEEQTSSEKRLLVKEQNEKTAVAVKRTIPVTSPAEGKNVQTCTERQLNRISNEDKQLLERIKHTGISTQRLLTLITNEVNGADVNNNTEQPVAQIDLTLADEELVTKILSQSHQNKILIRKMYESLHQNGLEKDQTAKPVKRHINVSEIVKELVEKLTVVHPNTPLNLCFNKGTQTDEQEKSKDTENIHATESGDRKLLQSQRSSPQQTPPQLISPKEPTPFKSPPPPLHLSQFSPILQNEDGNVDLNMHHVPGDTPVLQTTNNLQNYTNAPMMSILELPKILQQQVAYNNRNSTSEIQRNFVPDQHLQQPSYPSMAATNSEPSTAVTHSNCMQQLSADYDIEPSEVGIQQPGFMSRCNEVRCPSNGIRHRMRRMKTTPTRAMPYQSSGPRFPTPAPVGKYRMMMELQQKAWKSHMQNYPNTAWDHSCKHNY